MKTLSSLSAAAFAAALTATPAMAQPDSDPASAPLAASWVVVGQHQEAAVTAASTIGAARGDATSTAAAAGLTATIQMPAESGGSAMLSAVQTVNAPVQSISMIHYAGGAAASQAASQGAFLSAALPSGSSALVSQTLNSGVAAVSAVNFSGGNASSAAIASGLTANITGPASK